MAWSQGHAGQVVCWSDLEPATFVAVVFGISLIRAAGKVLPGAIAGSREPVLLWLRAAEHLPLLAIAVLGTWLFLILAMRDRSIWLPVGILFNSLLLAFFKHNS